MIPKEAPSNSRPGRPTTIGSRDGCCATALKATAISTWPSRSRNECAAEPLLDTLERARTPLDSTSPAGEGSARVAGGHRGCPTAAHDSRARRRRPPRPARAAPGLGAARGRGASSDRPRPSATGRLAAWVRVDLRALQSTLRPNEALLSFQVGLWETFGKEFGGGAWLIALTSQQRTVHRLPDRAQLAPMVPVFTGLIGRADGLDGPIGGTALRAVARRCHPAAPSRHRATDHHSRRPLASSAVRRAERRP